MFLRVVSSGLVKKAEVKYILTSEYDSDMKLKTMSNVVYPFMFSKGCLQFWRYISSAAAAAAAIRLHQKQTVVFR